jgi:hypothetical protein
MRLARLIDNEGNIAVIVSEITMTGRLVRCNRRRSRIRKTRDSLIFPTW